MGELIREEVAKLLINGVKDPRIGFVSVMSVRMSSDLHYANVYVSLYGSESEKKGSLIGLHNSTGWIRREVGKHLRLRYTPELRFFEDKTLETVYHLEDVFDEIHQQQDNAPMNQVELDTIAQELKSAGSFLLCSHVHPDGDAVGSILALYHLLRAMGKTRIQCVLADPVPKTYRTLPGADLIKNCATKPGAVDLVVIVDVAKFDRIGGVAEFIGPRQKVVIIDHHLEEHPDGTVGFIDPSFAAVGEIIAQLFHAAGIPMSRDAAHCVYVAQITDTGGYRYSNTNARSHRIAAELEETGIDAAGIAHEVFDIISMPKFELMRRVLHRAAFHAGHRVAYAEVSYKDLEEVGGGKEDLNGLVNYLRNIEGVDAGILFNEVEPGLSKVSLRSTKALNAAEFLQQFGGGGHAAAAGATIGRPLEEVMQDILGKLEEALGREAPAPAKGEEA